MSTSPNDTFPEAVGAHRPRYRVAQLPHLSNRSNDVISREGVHNSEEAKYVETALVPYVTETAIMPYVEKSPRESDGEATNADEKGIDPFEGAYPDFADAAVFEQFNFDKKTGRNLQNLRAAVHHLRCIQEQRIRKRRASFPSRVTRVYSEQNEGEQHTARRRRSKEEVINAAQQEELHQSKLVRRPVDLSRLSKPIRGNRRRGSREEKNVEKTSEMDSSIMKIDSGILKSDELRKEAIAEFLQKGNYERTEILTPQKASESQGNSELPSDGKLLMERKFSLETPERRLIQKNSALEDEGLEADFMAPPKQKIKGKTILELQTEESWYFKALNKPASKTHRTPEEQQMYFAQLAIKKKPSAVIKDEQEKATNSEEQAKAEEQNKRSFIEQKLAMKRLSIAPDHRLVAQPPRQSDQNEFGDQNAYAFAAYLSKNPKTRKFLKANVLGTAGISTLIEKPGNKSFAPPKKPSTRSVKVVTPSLNYAEPGGGAANKSGGASTTGPAAGKSSMNCASGTLSPVRKPKPLPLSKVKCLDEIANLSIHADDEDALLESIDRVYARMKQEDPTLMSPKRKSIIISDTELNSMYEEFVQPYMEKIPEEKAVL